MVSFDKTKPLAQLSDEHRDFGNECNSRKYYEHKLKSAVRLIFVYDVLITIGTSGKVGGSRSGILRRARWSGQ